ASVKPILSSGEQISPVVSKGFAAIYFSSREQLVPEAPALPGNSEFADIYRYDIVSGSLRFVVQSRHGYGQEPSPNGRYDYFRAVGVTGLPAGVEHCAQSECGQLFRFDSVDSVVECVSCASPFDPVPKLGVDNEGGALPNAVTGDGMPERS